MRRTENERARERERTQDARSCVGLGAFVITPYICGIFDKKFHIDCEATSSRVAAADFFRCQLCAMGLSASTAHSIFVRTCVNVFVCDKNKGSAGLATSTCCGFGMLAIVVRGVNALER